MNIVKYSNRKLYSLERTAYVSHQDVIEAIANGEEVKVRDKEGTQDLTREVLESAFILKAKQDVKTFDIPTLKSLIGGN